MRFINSSHLNAANQLQVYQDLGEREEQQDAFCISRSLSGTLVAIADGHGGAKTASLACARLPALFNEQLDIAVGRDWYRRYNGLDDNKMRMVLRRSVHQLIKQLEKEPSGATLTASFIEQGTTLGPKGYTPILRITTAQLGDSIFALSHSAKSLQVAPLHSVAEAPKDVEAIKALYVKQYGTPCSSSHYYIRSSQNGYDGLAITRGLGDLAFTLIRKPEIKTYFADPAQAIVLVASDGVLTSPINPRAQIRHVFKQLRHGMTIQEIGEQMPRKPDNVTLIALKNCR